MIDLADATSAPSVIRLPRMTDVLVANKYIWISALPEEVVASMKNKVKIVEIEVCKGLRRMAGTTGLEPATSDVTGRRSNQLNYVPAMSRTNPC